MILHKLFSESIATFLLSVLTAKFHFVFGSLTGPDVSKEAKPVRPGFPESNCFVIISKDCGHV